MAGSTEPGLTSVIVVAADSGPLLLCAVRSALVADERVELILVDNASTDGQVARVELEFPVVRVLHNPTNLGFGPACNGGARRARGDVLVFLNPDCELEQGCIAGMRQVLRENADIGLLGIEIREPDGSLARANRRRDPSLWRVLMSLSGLARLETRWPALAGVEMSPLQGGSAIEDVDAVSGACIAMPCPVFDAIGGFDEGYFLHVEDLDLCRRTRAAGWRVAIAHHLGATHAQGSSSHHRALFVARHKHRGMWRYFLKFDPAARNPLLRGLVWLGLRMLDVVDTCRSFLRGRP